MNKGIPVTKTLPTTGDISSIYCSGKKSQCQLAHNRKVDPKGYLQRNWFVVHG